MDLEELDPKELKRIKLIKKRRKLKHSFFYIANLKIWSENSNNTETKLMKPEPSFWFKSTLFDFELREKRAYNLFIKTWIKSDNEIM